MFGLGNVWDCVQIHGDVYLGPNVNSCVYKPMCEVSVSMQINVLVSVSVCLLVSVCERKPRHIFWGVDLECGKALLWNIGSGNLFVTLCEDMCTVIFFCMMTASPHMRLCIYMYPFIEEMCRIVGFTHSQPPQYRVQELTTEPSVEIGAERSWGASG